jgi:hypothetical protein
MPGWVWLILGVGVLGLIGLGVYIYLGGKAGQRMLSELREDGELTQAWIAHVEEGGGLLGPHVLLLISPDDVQPEEMRAILKRLDKIRDRKSRDTSERKIGKFIKDHQSAIWVEVGRLKLPKSFIADCDVYLVWMYINIDELEELGGDEILDEESIAVRLFWDRWQGLVVPEPKPKKRRRSKK